MFSSNRFLDKQLSVQIEMNSAALSKQTQPV